MEILNDEIETRERRVLSIRYMYQWTMPTNSMHLCSFTAPFLSHYVYNELRW